MTLSFNAIDLLEKRYAHKDETPEDVYKRVAKALAIRDRKFEGELTDAMLNGIFLPNSPTIVSAGRKNAMMSACFVLPIEDSIESIFDTQKNMAKIFQRGGGVGINFSSLRPKNASLSNGGTSSGTLSFMRIFNEVTEVVKQGGFRRGAAMGGLNFNHPEITDFCRAKLDGKSFQNFNLSVVATNDFMEKATKGGKVDLVHGGYKYNTLPAKSILDLIAFCAWQSGDPGILFYDRLNQDNKLFPKVKIEVTNPCQPGDALLIDGAFLHRIDKKYGYTWDSKKTGKKEVIELLCNNGLSLRFTPEHKIMLPDSSWSMAKDTLDKEIKWGLGKRVGGRDEWFELIGFLFGDGFKCGCGYGISVKLDPDKEPEVARMLLYNGFHRQENGAFYINNEENDLYSWVEFIDDRVWDRVLPDRYLFDNSTKSSSFLRGLFEANGSVNSHGQISLKATNLETIRRVQLAIASFGVPSWIVTNKPTDIKWKNGTYKSRQSYNLQIAPRCGTLFRDKIGFLSKRKNDRIKRFDKEYNGKLKVVSIRSLGEMEVWDYTMNDNPHYNFCQGVIAANCGEVPLPAFGACTLGSINISKMVEKDNFNFDMFHHYCELAARALLNCNIINWYPVNQIAKTMRELNPIGVGIMGFADALIMLGINYDSKECLDFIDQLCKPYVEATNNVAIDSFYHRSIAPTGSLSILANCSSGIEPVFDSIFERHLTVGVIEETRDIYTSKYLRTAHEVSPDWHLKVQAQFQKYIDAGVSKTINVSNDVDVETIKDIYIKAWKYGCKGITVFRDACKDGVLVSTRNKCEGDQCII